MKRTWIAYEYIDLVQRYSSALSTSKVAVIVFGITQGGAEKYQNQLIKFDFRTGIGVIAHIGFVAQGCGRRQERN